MTISVEKHRLRLIYRAAESTATILPCIRYIVIGETLCPTRNVVIAVRVLSSRKRTLHPAWSGTLTAFDVACASDSEFVCNCAPIALRIMDTWYSQTCQTSHAQADNAAQPPSRSDSQGHC